MKLMNNSIKQLLTFTEKGLPFEAIQEIEDFLVKNPVYFEVMGGLVAMKRELGSSEAVENLMKVKKEAIRDRLFS